MEWSRADGELGLQISSESMMLLLARSRSVLSVLALTACAPEGSLPVVDATAGPPSVPVADDTGTLEVSPRPATGWWSAMQARLAADAQQIAIERDGAVAWMPASTAQARFSPDGVTIGTDASASPLRLRFARWSHGETELSIDPTPPLLGACAGAASGPRPCTRRLEYLHPGVVEWWVGQERGIEVGWTVDEAPSGSGALRFVVQVDGADWIEATAEGAELVDAAGRTWSLSPATAWDAHGEPLPAWIEVGDAHFTVGVDAEGAAWPVTMDPVLTTADWTGTPPTTFEMLGHAGQGAGDVNGDGYDDVIVGARAYGSYTGRVYVYHGSASGLGTTAAQIIQGASVSDQTGYSVSRAGDVNGDGYDDILVTSYGWNSFQSKVDLYLGSASGISATSAQTFTGDSSITAFGLAITELGDINGDGYDDIAIGSANHNGATGRVFVFHGSASGMAATPDQILLGPASLAYYGRVLSEAGDVNHDGFDDMMVYQNSPAQVQVFHGSSSGFSATATTTISGSGGFGMSSAGDIDGDGYDDVILGNPSYASNTGIAYVYFGSALGLNTSFVQSIVGTATTGYFGLVFSGSGDFDSDGYDDVAITMLGYNGFAGQVSTYAGSASGLSTTPDSTISGTTSLEYLGHAISAVGDVNGDGYDDLLVGSYGYNSYDGRAEVFLGYVDADGDGLNPDCDDTDPTVGAPTTWYADVDGDGYGDPSDTVEACDAPTNYVADNTDCDDTRDDVNPGETEVCDSADVDEDCNGVADDADSGVDSSSLSSWYADNDLDGYGDPGDTIDACEVPTGYVSDGSDCDDTRDDVNPGETEVCDSADVDEDCNGVADDADSGVDPTTQSTWYADADLDGYGDPAVTIDACDTPTNYVSDNADCDDSRDDVNPSETEVCDADDVDEDCNGVADDADSGVDPTTMSTWYADEDEDGYGNQRAPTNACDLPDGAVADASDCDDTRSDINPGQTEICDPEDTDENCNGVADDADSGVDPTTMSTWYADEDADGFGDPDSATQTCDAPAGFVDEDSDCEDTRADVNPDGQEVCDPEDTDEDCNGVADDADTGVDPSTQTTWYADEDEDGFGDPDTATDSCNASLGFLDDGSDCDDTRGDVNPDGQEVCDADDTDEDCDGLVDDADDSVDPSGLITTWVDADGDGYGDPAEPQSACDPDASTVDNDEDCDDTNADAYPGAPSPVRNEVMDCDAAGYGSGSSSTSSTTSTDASSDGDKGSCATARASASLAWLAIAGLWSVAGRRRRTAS
ncbi:MAG TPA: hypothetical protein DFR83_25395 [Deltaproteobacteria bacterium]|nr:hypothetical protein [Deltaproteobacteria bacterium]